MKIILPQNNSKWKYKDYNNKFIIKIIDDLFMYNYNTELPKKSFYTYITRNLTDNDGMNWVPG